MAGVSGPGGFVAGADAAATSPLAMKMKITFNNTVEVGVHSVKENSWIEAVRGC